MKRTRKGLAWVLGTSLVIVGCDDSRFSSNGLGGMFQSAPEPEPVMRFGVLWENFVVDSGKVQPGESLSHLLDPTGIGPGKVATLAANSRKVWDVRYMKAGHRWWLASETAQDSGEAEARLKPKWLVYERNPKDFARFSLGDTLAVTLGSYPVDTLYARATGTIENSLYMDFDKAGHPTNLAVAMANVYAWTIDFSRVQKGDTYDVLYRREVVNGRPVGMPEVLSSTFSHWGRPLDAHRFENDGIAGYYDLEGGSLQKVFLKAPVEFSRISSRYNPKRFHPVLKKVKGHFGTDYAAPHGTPIVAVGDGVVTKSGYTSGNGKFVKIRHNSTYETQYLHMSRRAVKKANACSKAKSSDTWVKQDSPLDHMSVSVSGNTASKSIIFGRISRLPIPSRPTFKEPSPFRCLRTKLLPSNSSPTRPWPQSNRELNPGSDHGRHLAKRTSPNSCGQPKRRHRSTRPATALW